MPKANKIVVVIQPPGKGPRSDDIPTPEQITADFPDDQDDKPTLFPPPAYRPIEIPMEFREDSLLSDTFRLATHEIGHALGNLLYAGRVDAVVLTASVASGGMGRSYGHGGTGEDGARVSLAGLAAERLVAGTPLDLSGFKSDMESARTDLRFVKVPEVAIDARAQAIYFELQRTFAKKWTHAIVAAATALTKRGILDGNTLFGLFSQAQEYADDAGTLTKAFKNVVVGNGTGPAHIDTVKFSAVDPFASLQKSLASIGKANQVDRVAQLHKATEQPGISAHEVARREAMRNHADQRAGGNDGTAHR